MTKVPRGCQRLPGLARSALALLAASVYTSSATLSSTLSSRFSDPFLGIWPSLMILGGGGFGFSVGGGGGAFGSSFLSWFATPRVSFQMRAVRTFHYLDMIHRRWFVLL